MAVALEKHQSKLFSVECKLVAGHEENITDATSFMVAKLQFPLH